MKNCANAKQTPSSPVPLVKTWSIGELTDQYRVFVEEWEGQRIATGFAAFDAPLKGGMLPGEIAVVLGKAGVGKTALALNLVWGLAKNTSDRRILILSLEMGRVAIAGRLGQIVLGLDEDKLIERIKQDQEGVRTAMGEALPGVHVCDDRYTLSRIETAIQHLRPEIVVVDHLGLVRSGQPSLDRNSYERASQVVRGLQSIAKKHRVAMVMVQQITRTRRKNPYGPVSLEGSRDSGVIEETADFILSLYRSEYERPDAQGLVMGVLKNRRGVSAIEDEHLLLEFSTYRILKASDVS